MQFKNNKLFCYNKPVFIVFMPLLSDLKKGILTVVIFQEYYLHGRIILVWNVCPFLSNLLSLLLSSKKFKLYFPGSKSSA